jgi:Flp pilus assembly pilin Flp
MHKKAANRNRKGQGLTEYIIVVALVAIAAIGIVNIFGNQLRNQFSTIITAMSGSSQKKVESLSDQGRQETNKKSLSDYAGSK